MSPRDRVFWETVQRRAASLQPDVAADVLRAFRIIRESLTDTELARLIAQGQIDRVLDEAMLDRAFLPLQERLRKAVERSFDLTTHADLPNGGRVDGVIGVAFDYLNPKVVDAVRSLDSRVIADLKTDTRDAIRAFVENGLRDGRAHTAVAREIRQIVGLSPRQIENAAKFRAKLESSDAYSTARVDSMVAAYERQSVAQNAKTISRTATLDSLKLGQKLAWDDAVEKGILDATRLVKTWVGVLDDRIRDEHRAMHGQTVRYNETYSNGDTIPGENDYNCRCVSRIKQLPPSARRAA